MFTNTQVHNDHIVLNIILKPSTAVFQGQLCSHILHGTASDRQLSYLLLES